MRTIRFRGKSTESEEWVFGSLDIYGNGNTYIKIPVGIGTLLREPVYAQSVGQYIGMFDRNGKAIYEGDVVIIYEREFDEDDEEVWVLQNSIHQVLWDGNRFAFRLKDTEGYWSDFRPGYESYEIIGNFYDRKKED